MLYVLRVSKGSKLPQCKVNISGFIYRVPIYRTLEEEIQQVENDKYAGMSIDKIREKYGDNAATDAYTDSCRGIDVTKFVDDAEWLNLSYWNCVDISIRHGGGFPAYKHRVYLSGNEYSSIKADILLFEIITKYAITDETILMRVRDLIPFAEI